MNKTMLNLVIELFQASLQQRGRVEESFHRLSDELDNAQCKPQDFADLLAWLNAFDAGDRARTLKKQTQQARRFYTPCEQEKLSAEARQYLTQLYRSGTIDMRAREHIIEQIMALDFTHITSDQLKWIALLAFIHHNALDHFQHRVEKFIEFYHTVDMD